MGKNNFSKYRLRDCTLDVVDNRGKNPPSGYFSEGEYPVLDNYLIQNTLYPDLKQVKRYINQETHDNFLRGYLEKDDVIVTLVGNGICNASLSPSSNVVIIQNTIGIKTNEKLVNKFLYYYFLHNQKALVKLDRGSSQPSVNKNDLLDFEIEIPDLSTQQKIAAVLTALDAKIELNARINAELDFVAKTLYDYWFVQFAPHKSAGGGMIWNEALKREIPLGWEVAELGDFAQPIRGVTYKKDDIKKSSDKNAIPILRATNITNGVIDLNDMVYVPEEVVSEEQYLNKFDVLITMSSGSKAHVGKNAFYYFDQKVSFGAFCSKLSVNKDMRFYVNTQMQSDSFKKYIANVGLGTNINNLTNKHITEYKLLIPPKELLLQYENTVEGFYNRIGNNMKESQTLTELRDWLLPMLMNGQIQVQT